MPGVLVQGSGVAEEEGGLDKEPMVSSWEMMFSRPRALPVACVVPASRATWTMWMWKW